MAQLMDHVEYLSREIGARPAGTEEEQQSALYIAEQFQSEAGFSASIEEFTSSSNLEGGRAILAMITIVVSILAMLFNVLTLPAFILAAVAAVIYFMEAYDKPVVSRALARGASQNVVAKYQPSNEGAATDKKARTRKVVLVAHYDTGKVTPALVRRVESIDQPIGMICVGAMVAAAVLLLLRIFVGGTGGIIVLLLNVLTILAIIIVAYPVLKAILYRIAPYNEGANNNATGVAALIEIARRISRGSVSEADLAAAAEDVVLHGEEAALASGLVPEGAELNYEADFVQPEVDDGEDATEEDRLLAAKAAIAALTGRPVEQRVYVSQEELDQLEASRREAAVQAAAPTVDQVQQVQADDQPFNQPDSSDSEQVAAISAPAPVVAPAVAGGFENAPSWFIEAQRNAKRPAAAAEPVQRSKYALAIEAAEREMAAREQARLEEERRIREQELREKEEATRAALAAKHEQERLAREAAQAKAREEKERALAEAAAQAQAEAAAVAADVVDIADAGAPAEPVIAALSDATDLADLPADINEIAPLADIPAIGEVAPPETFAEYLGEPSKDEVDLGATLAFTPAQIRKALEEEKAEMQRAQEQDAAPEAPAISALADVPAVEQASAPKVPETTNPSRSGMFRRLRTDIPSMSGVIRMQDSGQDVSQTPEDIARAVKRAENAKIALDVPVIDIARDDDIEADEVFEGVEPAESVLEEQAPEPAKEAAPRRGLLSKLRRKGSDPLEQSPQEWLDIEGDYDPRTVGRERGGWESFRRDDGGREEGRGSGSWQGGAFSRVRLGRVNMLSGEDTHSDEPEELSESVEDHQLNEEIESIYHFRNPSYNTEIWFVAIGSDTELHDGARAFVAEHGSELRGSTIIEVESLGLGPLAVVAEEGQFKKVQSSSRVKRYTRPATEVTGIVLDQAKTNQDSVSSTIQKAGYQVVHFTGVEDGKPSLKGSADDVLENVDEMTLEENIDFLMELLKRG